MDHEQYAQFKRETEETEANSQRDRSTQPWANAHPPVWSEESKKHGAIDPSSPGANFYGKVAK